MQQVTDRPLGRPRPYPAWMAPAPLKPHRPQALKLLIAWIDAASADPGYGKDSHPATCKCGCMHIYLDMVEAELARELAKLSPVDRYLPETTSEDIRRRLAERGVRSALLGDWDEKTGEFHPGLAGLTEQEARATELKAEKLNEWEIAAAMDRKRARMFKDTLSVETVTRYIRGGQGKLRAFFELTNAA